jgi:hypothetical protein
LNKIYFLGNRQGSQSLNLSVLVICSSYNSYDAMFKQKIFKINDINIDRLKNLLLYAVSQATLARLLSGMFGFSR